MPLQPGKSQQVVSNNISELYKANAFKPQGKKRPRKQIIAIALSNARKNKKTV